MQFCAAVIRLLHEIEQSGLAEVHQSHVYLRLVVLPVPGPGFLDRFRAGLGHKVFANGPTSGPKLPGPFRN